MPAPGPTNTMTDAPRGDPFAKAHRLAVVAMVAFGAMGAFAVWNLFHAVNEGRVLATGKFMAARWIALADHPGSFWFAVAASVGLLAFVSWVLAFLVRSVRVASRR